MESEDIGFKSISSKVIGCPNCLAVNDEFSISCQRCNSSLGSGLDPLSMARSEGDLLGKTTQARPKLIVLLVVWLIFLPIFLFSAATIVKLVLTGGGTSGFMFFWFSVVMLSVSFYFLYQVTFNYFGRKNIK